MNAKLKTLLTILLSVAALGAGSNALASGHGHKKAWNDHGRYDQRWDHRHHGKHDKRYYVTPVYRQPVYYYSAPKVVHPPRVVYEPVVYRYTSPGVVISLPPIVIR